MHTDGPQIDKVCRYGPHIEKECRKINGDIIFIRIQQSILNRNFRVTFLTFFLFTPYSEHQTDYFILFLIYKYKA